MLRVQLAAVCLFLIIAAGSSAKAQEQTILNGTWMITSLTFNGKVSGGGHTSLFFSGDRYEQAVDGIANEHGFLRLDQTKNPMTIDFIVTDGGPANSVQLGIIEVTGDTMRLHLNLGSPVRPVNFDPVPLNLLIVAKKQ